jgi:hypothetical protein
MADQYITVAYVDARIGMSVRQALSDDGVAVLSAVETATALVQGRLRNSGYTTPTTTTDQGVMAAVMGCVWQSLADQPNGINLPDNWKTNPYYLAMVDVLNGDYQPDPSGSHSLNTRDAVGGAVFSDSSSTASTVRAQRSSRTNLAGY